MKFLVAGLGNIGNEYANTRHNIGFDVVNAFVQKHGAAFAIERHAYIAEFGFKGKKIICICPTTYMNLSGKAIKYWIQKEHIALENMLVVLDDLSIPITDLRLRAAGSSGGHNGLKSIEAELGTRQYSRLRFGIGNNYPRGMQAEFVLSKWQKAEALIVIEKIQQAIAEIEEFLQKKPQ